jgi:hypothetical protein
MNNKIVSYDGNLRRKKVPSIDNVALFNSNRNKRLRNKLVFRRINLLNNSNNTYDSHEYPKNFYLTRLKGKLSLNKINKVSHFSRSMNNIKEKIFKKEIPSEKDLDKSSNFVISNDLDFSNNSNLLTNKYIFSEIKNDTKKTKDKMNQTSTIFFTKKTNLSNNNTIYFNSSLENFYNKIIHKKLNLMSPSKTCFFPSKKNNINTYNNKKNTKNIENKYVKSTGYNSYNEVVLKNLFQKSQIKIKTNVFDRALSKYKLRNNKVLLNPFMNSYGVMLENLSDKIGFIKGSLDLVYPKIIKKKYQLRMKYKYEKNGISVTSRNNSLENNKSIKNEFFIINKEKKISQSIFTKYPINIKIKGKISPNMYSFRGTKMLIL